MLTGNESSTDSWQCLSNPLQRLGFLMLPGHMTWRIIFKLAFWRAHHMDRWYMTSTPIDSSAGLSLMNVSQWISTLWKPQQIMGAWWALPSDIYAGSFKAFDISTLAALTPSSGSSTQQLWSVTCSHRGTQAALPAVHLKSKIARHMKGNFPGA